MSAWVCSICGSNAIEESSIQPSLGDEAHPLGLCWGCRPNKPKDPNYVKTVLSPLMTAEEWQGKLARRRVQAQPEDLFAGFDPSAFAVRATRR